MAQTTKAAEFQKERELEVENLRTGLTIWQKLDFLRFVAQVSKLLHFPCYAHGCAVLTTSAPEALGLTCKAIAFFSMNAMS
jgi:hypothetical protein